MILSGIAIFYFVCLAVGFLFALIGAIFGEIGGHAAIEAGGHEVEFGHGEIGGHGVELGHGVDAAHEMGPGGHAVGVGDSGTADMPGAHLFNTITMCVFLAFFGLAGLFAIYILRLGPFASVLFAFPTAIIIAVAQFLMYVKFFIKAQASSEATMSDVLGCEAEVITSIPGDRVGEIAYTIKGSRYTSPAVSANGEDIPRCTKVHVVNLRGSTLVVRAM